MQRGGSVMSDETASTRKGARVSLWSLPNQLTTLRLLLSFVLFVTISHTYWRASLVLFIGAAITDWLDGYFARKQGLVSSFGRMYDPLIDKVLVSGAFIFLMEFPASGIVGWMVTIVVAREFLVTGIRGYIEELGISFGADQLGKIKMALQCVALIWLFIFFDLGLNASEERWPFLLRDTLNYAAIAATLVSGLNYLRRALPYLS